MLMHNFLYSLEPYIFKLLLIHFILSVIIAFFSTFYLKSRFINNEKTHLKDKKILEELAEGSFIYKLLFKISQHKHNTRNLFLFFFTFTFSLPFIGYFSSLWVIWYLKHVKYQKTLYNTNILNIDEFGISFLKVERVFGEGSMKDVLKNQYVPKSKKLKALSTLANNISPANLRIIKQTLSSSDDEIRLYGYAIINKAELRLNSKINKYLSVIEEEKKKKRPNKETVAFASKELAFLYWEMIYTELSHESLKESFINKVEQYLKTASNFYLTRCALMKKELLSIKKDKDLPFNQKEHLLKELEDVKDICIKLYTLNGRLFMSKKDYKSAEIEFLKALELGDEKAINTIPYLCEILFMKKDYAKVKELMQEAKNLELNATLYPILKQWEAVS